MSSMTICKRCGWQIVRGNWGWKDLLNHETCGDYQVHEPAVRITK
jgi:hypothetical protein